MGRYEILLNSPKIKNNPNDEKGDLSYRLGEVARQLEDKALKCITIAQRILPGASDIIIEEQATDFMSLSESTIVDTLQRIAKRTPSQRPRPKPGYHSY